MRKDKAVTTLFTREDHTRICEFARDLGLSTPAFIRQMTLEGANIKPVLDEDERYLFLQLLSDLRAIGVNLNQIARAINSKRFPSNAEINFALDLVKQVVTSVHLETRMITEKAGNRRREGLKND